jgi:hypothetical protein
VQRHGWDEVLALMQSLGDLAHLRWDDLKGLLSRREWAEARRIGELLARLPRLAGFIDGVGRRQPAPKAANAEQAGPNRRPGDRAARHPGRRTAAPARTQAVDGVHRSRALARMTGADSEPDSCTRCCGGCGAPGLPKRNC